MRFNLFKAQKTEVDIDFDKLYQTIKKELGVKPDDFDCPEDYCYEICDHFNSNTSQYLTEVCGVNFYDNTDITEPYYDIEANDITLVRISNEFENYVYDMFDC